MAKELEIEQATRERLKLIASKCFSHLVLVLIMDTLRDSSELEQGWAYY